MKVISLAASGQNRVVSTQKNVVSKDQSIELAVVNQTPSEWVIDPSCAAFPPMQHDEFIALRASIERNGQNEPILVWGIAAGPERGAGRMQFAHGADRVAACGLPGALRCHGSYRQGIPME